MPYELIYLSGGLSTSDIPKINTDAINTIPVKTLQSFTKQQVKVIDFVIFMKFNQRDAKIDLFSSFVKCSVLWRLTI